MFFYLFIYPKWNIDAETISVTNKVIIIEVIRFAGSCERPYLDNIFRAKE